MEKKRILITFGTRPLALRITKRLNNRYEVIYASSEEIPDLLLKSGNYFRIPSGLLPTFAHEMLKLCLDQQIDLLLPLGVFELKSLTESKTLFEEYGVAVLAPDKEVLVELPILENPPAVLPLLLLSSGHNLLDDTAYTIKQDGLFAAGDSGEELALCCVSK